MNFNFIDIIILLISAMFVFKSYRKGFTGEVFGILAIIIAFALSLKLNPVLSKYVFPYIKSKSGSSILTFVLTFIIFNIIIRKVGTSIKKFLEYIYLGWFDSLAGALLGAVKAIAFCTIIIIGLKMIPFGGFDGAIKKSKIAPHLEKISTSFYSVLKKGFPKELNKKFFSTSSITRTFFSD